MISREDYYRERARFFFAKAGELQRRENRLSLSRLLLFTGSFLFFVILLPINGLAAAVILISGLSAFAFVVVRYVRVQKQKNRLSHLATINTLEAECLKGNFSSFPDGSSYIDREHPYSYDLDLFGQSSLFQYINRTVTRPASDMLASWLKAPASTDVIKLRQQATEELKPLTEWRQEMITLCYENKDAGADPDTLLSWLNSGVIFKNRLRSRIIAILLSLTSVTAAVLVLLGMPAGILATAVTVNILYYLSRNRDISKLHLKVTRSSEMLDTYASAIAMAENAAFKSQGLRELQSVFNAGGRASASIKRLSQLVNRLDTRLNVLVSAPLNIFFFQDIHLCLALEKWNANFSDDVRKWIDAMAELEVLASFGNMAFNNPGWVIPEITGTYFNLEARDLGHPLLPAHQRITNSLSVNGKGKTALITGSNMSGKSTFLRTCGINTVLALAGSVVCASYFKVPVVQVFTSMRISDSLEDNTSSFYAELKRLAAIIKEAENKSDLFLLLDEILRGTNSNDRYIGSVALIKQLTDYEAVSVVATHDLKLADLAADMPGHIDNYHFDVKINGEELYFDYKLTPGICTSLNASILMKKMGIKV